MTDSKIIEHKLQFQAIILIITGVLTFAIFDIIHYFIVGIVALLLSFLGVIQAIRSIS